MLFCAPFFKKNDESVRYNHIKASKRKMSFTRAINGWGDMYNADVCKVMAFLTDNIFAWFGGCLFHQVIRIPMETSHAQLLNDLFLYT